MYKPKDRKTELLFKELLPLGGKLDENNRWFKYHSLIDWEKLEQEYLKNFSNTGRPALDARLVIGALCIKHMMGVSDVEVVIMIQENPYMQYFCGLEQFATKRLFDDSSLTKLRKKLGVKFFKEFEKNIIEELKKRRIIRTRGMIIDATVFPSKLKYPIDTGLLNDAREWLVKVIEELSKEVGKRVRTYKRVARKAYLNLAKKRNKTVKEIRRGKKQMLQYVRRNIKQLKELLEEIGWIAGYEVKKKVRERLKVMEKIYEQQRELYRENARQINDRIISLHQPEIRPICRGKAGRKTEFGPKGALTLVDKFLFLDRIENRAFSEADTEVVKEQIANFGEKFGKKPKYCVGDGLYGTRENREMLKGMEIRDAFKKLGRKTKGSVREGEYKWRRKKQRERNRIEGYIGNLKEHYGCGRIRYRIVGGDEIEVRMGLAMMNMRTAAQRV
jgi:IS5 family transposase